RPNRFITSRQEAIVSMHLTIQQTLNNPCPPPEDGPGNMCISSERHASQTGALGAGLQKTIMLDAKSGAADIPSTSYKEVPPPMLGEGATQMALACSVVRMTACPSASLRTTLSWRGSPPATLTSAPGTISRLL